jgi:hypothetical protein
MSEQLIYALSSLGQVTLDHYNELFRMLYLPVCGVIENETEINHRGQVGRTLESLGYLEIDYGLRKVFVCPPALVMLPSRGLPKALLTGARTPALLKKLKKVIDKNKKMVKMHRGCQSRKWISLPDVFWVEAADIDSLKNVASESEIIFDSDIPAAWKMANSSVSIRDIESELVFTARKDIEWKKRIFSTEQLRFSYSKGDTGDYQLAEYTHPFTQQRMHWIWDKGQASETGRDWGRYLILKHTGKNILIYDEAKEYLGVPLTVPLPGILARAAALSSGKAPLISKINCEKFKMPTDVLFYLYQDIPEVLAKIITEKVGQKIILTKIDLHSRRGDYD